MAKRKTTINLDPDLRTATKAVALASDRSESEVTAEALRRYLGAGHAVQAGAELERILGKMAQRQDRLSDEDAMALAVSEVRAHRAERRGNSRSQ
ncbi:MAG: hypothetical protein ACYDHB_05760 [Candidatus Dormibacteria bacterium]